MLLSEVFVPQFIICGLKEVNKEKVFEEMSEHFCKATKKNVQKEIIASLKERESKMSTGIQEGIAIPHAKTTVLDDVYGVLGVSKTGIDYDSLDGKPVHLVMMLLAPPVEAERHLHLLQRMAAFLRNQNFYTSIIEAPDGESIYQIIKKYESEDSEVK